MVALPGNDSIGQDQHRSPRLPRLNAVATLAVVVLMGSSTLAMSRDNTPSPDLELRSFAVSVVDGSDVEARVVVANTTREEIVGTVGFLASIPGGEAWSDRAYRSTEQPVNLQAGESAVLLWQEAIPVAAGDYTFSAWARVQRGTSSRHADALARPGPPIHVEPQGTFQRIQLPDGGVSVHGVSLQNGSPAGWTTKVQVLNDEDADRTVSVRLELLAASPNRQSWWKVPFVLAEERELSIPAGQAAATQISSRVLLMPGEYVARILVTDSVDRSLLDQALPTDTVLTVPAFDPSITRAVPPSGDLVIQSVDADPSWSVGQPAVSVAVRNLSDQPVVGVFWWHLGDPGDPKPWVSAAATSSRVRRTLTPGETDTIRLIAYGPVPEGTGYELSVWVHESLMDSSVHSDEVRFSEAIDVIGQEE